MSKPIEDFTVNSNNTLLADSGMLLKKPEGNPKLTTDKERTE